MRILVTGAPGFIGSEVTRALMDRGHDILALCRPGEDTRRIAELRSKLALRELDLDDFSAVDHLLAIERPECLVHLAWYASPSDYLTSPNNLRSLSATLSLAESALRHGCKRLVCAGTCLEYLDKTTCRREEDPCVPSSLYASCKVAAHTVLRSLTATSKAELVWGRVFHLHGPGEAPARLLPWVTLKLHHGQPVELTDGTQLRDHLHVADVATAFCTLAESAPGGAYNVCSGQPVSLRLVLETVGNILGRTDLLNFGARPHGATDSMTLFGTNQKLRNLGWQPHFSFEDGLRDAVLGYLADPTSD